jgi:glycerol-3-phosphate acyltransferase PlsX
MVIAVDAAGGDFIPQNPVLGALEAVASQPDLHVILVGPQASTQAILADHTYDHSRITVVDAPEVIDMHESPAKAIKGKPNSSIAVGLTLHKEGKCDAFVSAGNTGALLAASTVILGRLPGVLRPTIVTYYPTVKGFRLLVDAGANVEVRPEILVQFAKMGEIYARDVMGIADPNIGLLNVGEEEEKGTEVLKETHQLLRSHPRFIGNVEGRDLLPATADVYVCDGLVGNILLKFGESLVANLGALIKATVKEMQLPEEAAKTVFGVFQKTLKPFDPDNVGGLPFLGVNGVSLVGHGSSSPKAIRQMIFNAVHMVEAKVNEKIITALR